MKKSHYFTVIFVLILFTAAQAGTIISNVAVNSPTPVSKSTIKTNSANNKHTITWQSRMPGEATMLISDQNGNIVRTFIEGNNITAGNHTINWDGTDDSGNLCPGGLYFPIIKMKTIEMGVETYNPTALPWGQEITPQSIIFDSDAQVIRYTIAERILCRIRVGERDGGPFYKTVSDWTYRSPGTYEQAWDGMDTEKIISVHQKTKLQIAFDAFSVPENTIFIQGELPPSTRTTYKYYPLHPPHGKQLAYYFLNDHGLGPDLTITAKFDSGVIKENDTYQLHGQVPITVELVKGTLGTNPPETIELYLYIDGKMLHEGSVTELPAQVNLDSRTLSNDFHIVTINMRTSGDRAASTSMKVRTENIQNLE